MFERFTERARQVVVLAQEEARTLKHNSIGTEHLLLGLLREQEGLAARVLESLGITIDAARADVVRIVHSGETATSGQIPFTPRAKKVLELALDEALTLGHNYIGTEHLLLGLTRVAQKDEGVAAQILGDFDATPEKIRDHLTRMLSGPRQARGTARGEARVLQRDTSVYVRSSEQVRRLLITAAARALDDGRSEIDGADLLLALTRDEATSRLLASLGVDVTAVRTALERQSPPPS
ncbi:MAG: Clp protease N-terminal domain-containing protein [Solirubrobacteraceae bacterium]